MLLPEHASPEEISWATDEAEHRAVMAAIRKAGYSGWSGYHFDGVKDSDGQPYLIYLTRSVEGSPNAFELGPLCDYQKPTVTRLRGPSRQAQAEADQRAAEAAKRFEAKYEASFEAAYDDE